jgi:hypothetical protein
MSKDPGYEFGDTRDEIKNRAQAAGMSWSLEDYSGVDEDELELYGLVVDFPNGREKRRVLVTPGRADRLKVVTFEEISFLGRYDAVHDRGEGNIEAAVSFVGRRPLLFDMITIPGAEILEVDPESGAVIRSLGPYFAQEDLKGGDSSRMGASLGKEHSWRLVIENCPTSMEVEISPVSPTLTGFFSFDPVQSSRLHSGLTLKIRGATCEGHDSAVSVLEDVSSSIFFEIDVRFNISLRLVRRQAPARRSRAKKRDGDDRVVEFPRIRYSPEATTLYFYGKSAGPTPLLQYLAYYQAIEFFFPSFFNAELIGRVRNELRDPRFNWSSDRMIQRVIQLAARGGRGVTSERDQLRATVDQSLDDSDLRQLFDDFPEMAEVLAEKSLLAGIPPVATKAQARLVEQVSERMYTLRCRIVHSKDAGGQSAIEPLLPYSKDADRLAHDIHLAEFVCQKVIIAGSRERHL